MTDVIPWMQNDQTIAEMAFSLWSWARYEGKEPLSESGCWAQRKNVYLEAARYVCEDMDRRAVA